MTISLTCGMPDESRIIKRALPDLQVLSGTDKFNLPYRVSASCTLIVSVGLCGGLAKLTADGHDIGACVLASKVMDEHGDIAVPDPIWSGRIAHLLAAAKINAVSVPYYSSGVLDQADSKLQRATLFAKYGAKAIDDETRFVVALAQQRQISFGVLRFVSDDWTETLPLAATGAIMNKDGSANIDYLMRSIAKEPAYDTVDLFKVGIDYSTSLNALEAGLNAAKGVFVQ